MNMLAMQNVEIVPFDDGLRPYIKLGVVRDPPPLSKSKKRPKPTIVEFKRIPGHRLTLDYIIRYVCAKHQIPRAVLLSKRRQKAVSEARQEAQYIAIRFGTMANGEAYSFSEIGRRMHRDHTTVMHNCRMYARRRGLKPVTKFEG